MGSRFEFCIAGVDETAATELIDELENNLAELEKILTTYDQFSDTNRVNELAGINPVKVDQRMFFLVEQSLFLSDKTKGAFDITYGSLHEKFWNFDASMSELPEVESEAGKDLASYADIEINVSEMTVFLRKKGMRIGFGGIGKGYAAEYAMSLLKERGVKHAIVNASGDMCCIGHAPGNEHWSIGIRDPYKENEDLFRIALSDYAVATSGNYEKKAIINDQLFSHTIDPSSGIPVAGLKSVTVIAPTATSADAMATAISVAGVKKGLGLIKEMGGHHCFIVDNFNQYHVSDGFSAYVQNE